MDGFRGYDHAFVSPPTGDLLGMLLAWFSLLPIFILVGFATLVLFRRDLHTVSHCNEVKTNIECDGV